MLSMIRLFHALATASIVCFAHGISFTHANTAARSGSNILAHAPNAHIPMCAYHCILVAVSALLASIDHCAISHSESLSHSSALVITLVNPPPMDSRIGAFGL